MTVLAVAAFSLVSCGGDKQSEFVKLCVEESGESKSICECQISAMTQTLGGDNFQRMSEFAKNKDETGAETLMVQLINKDPDVGTKLGKAMIACEG